MPSYLYGVVAAGSPPPEQPGLHGASVEVAPVDDRLAVLRSDLDEDDVEPRRAHLTAHDRVLAAAMAAGPVLPLRFGIVTSLPADRLADDLDVDELESRMQVLEGHVEVQVLWDLDEDAALPRVVQADPGVRDQSMPAVDRGRRVSEGLAELATSDLEAILGRIAEHVRATTPVERRGAAGARAALLVADGAVAQVEETCARLAADVASLGSLRVVARLPPYSFADTATPLEVG